MDNFLKNSRLLHALLAGLGTLTAAAQTAPQAGEEAIGITSITPSVSTGQDYSPWLNDDPHSLVQNNWNPSNFQYIDVTLQLAKPTVLSRLSLFDFEGVFTDQPATIYALSGGQRTLIGTFTGQEYNQYVTMAVAGNVPATAIVVHKFCNNIPVKIKVFGRTGSSPPPTTTPVPATLTFGSLPARTVGDAPFALAASSTNASTPIAFTSSNPGVLSVSNASGQWLGTVGGAGTATITASQAASAAYGAASATQTQEVRAATAPAPPAAPATPSTPPAGPVANGKITLDPSRWYSLDNVSNNIQGLFDNSTSSGVTMGWGKILETYDAYYTLLPGESISLESIRLFDGGAGDPNKPMTLSVLTSTWQRVVVATYTGGHNGQWIGPDPANPGNFKLSTPVSNIRALVLTASWAYPGEMELYGSYTPGAPLPTADPMALAVQKGTRLRQEMGINAFEWDVEDPNAPGQIDEARLKAVKNFTGFRHYLDWEKLESSPGNYTFNPVHSGGWNYDALYQRLKSEGIDVLVCLKTLPNWLLDTYPGNERDLENVPVRYGRDFADPNSYLEQAKVAFQFISRYGYNPGVNPGLLHVDPSTRWPGDGVNQVRVGLGVVKYIECDNERDKWWKGRKAYQTGREYAANLSAFYDGHKNSMGPGVGVKNADPGVQVVMGGLASPNPDYVRGMIDWCRQYRGTRADGSVDLCWDVINYHLYSNDARSSQSGNPTRGAAPEVSEAGQVAQDFVRLAHQYARDMPVWVTETGYDTNPGSPLKAVAIGNKSVLETQADWTLRTALLYARWGVERTFHYQLADDNPGNAQQFSSMGLINQDHTPKPAADFLRQTASLLGDFVYKGTLNRDPIVDRYEANGRTAYALVVPDERNRTATYTLSVGADSAYIYQPQAGRAAMRLTRVRTSNGQLQLTVTETPTFVVGAGTSAAPAAKVACPDTGSIQWEQWTGIGGSHVALIPTGTPPSETARLTQFESGRNVGNNYGARIRGYLCPPQDGSYTFRLSGSDDCQLWLSADEDPAHKTLIAGFEGGTGYHEWNKYASQQSGPMVLLAGHRYYVEALQKEAGEADNLSVAWTLPNGQVEAPILGAHLIPFGTLAANAAMVPATGQTPELTVYPTPFAEHTSVAFTLPRAGHASLAVYNLQSRLVRRLFNGWAEAGTRQQVTLSGAGLPQGVYIVRLVTADKVLTQKLQRVD
ncbi:PA14 domain-containing protein [Hymenobacter sp. BT770]|uniref:PA14 domain-containing protein n=1 Tax=Hymenobacter sp. BT770 TaxID=2886942 RepID=UPI001D10B7BF|nr:PA14 domain-containing protein [Hymenobacter sp. BT770]MCC3155138.1 T9SS type A sorting domain-containing protein [Hymenobacter sp. BT770]MDO3417139.1 PA14 domain-containing protein [Hymenobacter sp. BT770]